MYLAAASIVVGLLVLAVLIALGRTPDTTRPGRDWYPAGPDPEPWGRN